MTTSCQRSTRAKRTPCRNCQWRASTPPHGFPGGNIEAGELRRMASGAPPPDPTKLDVMGCHATDHRTACAGFVLVVGRDSVGLRIASTIGAVDLGAFATDGPLLDVETMIARHNAPSP